MLFTNRTVQVSYPGVVKVEEVHDNEAHSSWAGASTPRSNLGERRRGRPKRQRDPDEEIALETFDANNEDAPQLSQVAYMSSLFSLPMTKYKEVYSHCVVKIPIKLTFM